MPAALAAASRARLSEFSAQNLANLALGCAYLRFEDGPLLAAVAKEVRAAGAFILTGCFIGCFISCLR